MIIYDYTQSYSILILSSGAHITMSLLVADWMHHVIQECR